MKLFRVSPGVISMTRWATLAHEVAVIRDAHSAAEERHESERNQQRGVLCIAAGLFVAAVVTIVLQAIMPAWASASDQATLLSHWELRGQPSLPATLRPRNPTGAMLETCGSAGKGRM